MVHIKGPKLSEDGLYKFNITILTADGYSKKLAKPLVFNAGISIPEWIRNNALWWSEGQIDDDTFIQGLEFLIQRGIIHV